MKPTSLALFLLALVVVTAWPLSSAIGVGAGTTAAGARDVAAACAPGALRSDGGAAADRLGLPPGHPPIDLDGLPPGHPPVAGVLPPGHPPVPGAPRLPRGHPPVPSNQGPRSAGPAPLFGAPVLLEI